MREKTIVCFGDAAPDEYSLDAEERWPARLRSQLDTDAPGGYRVIDQELPGLRAAAAIARIDHSVAFHRPLLVTLRFGGSDSRPVGNAPPTPVARFEANLRALGLLIRERTGAIVAFVIAPATPGPTAPDDPVPPYHNITRRVAYELNAPVLDLYPRLPRPRAHPAGRPAPEGRSLTAQWHQVYAGLAVDFIRRLV